MIINQFMVANYLTKQKNQIPCMKVDLDEEKAIAVCELVTVEESALLTKVECNIISYQFILIRNENPWDHMQNK